MNILRSAVLLLLVAGALTSCGKSAKITGPLGATHSPAALSGGGGSSNPPSGGDSLQVEFKGVIESIAAPSLVVAGRTVVTDSHTEVRDSTGHVTLSALAVGQNVEVEGTKQADGSVLAREISVRAAQAPAPAPKTNRVEVRGLITEIGTDHLTVGGTLVAVDATTRFNGFALLSDLKLGQDVEVRALKQADGSLLAQLIELHHAEDDGGEQGDGAGHH